MMLRMTSLSKSFDGCCLFKDVCLSVVPAEHVVLYGPHNSGKTTLLRIILGMECWQDGKVSIRPATWFGYLPQTPINSGFYTVGEVLQTAREDFYASARCWMEYGQLTLDVRDLEADAERKQAELIRGLELQYIAPKYFVGDLGWSEQRRIWLASLLLAEPDVLVLDEPTDGLGDSAREWFIRFLENYRGTALIASTDWLLLDRVADKIWDIRPRNQTIVQYRRRRTGLTATAVKELTEVKPGKQIRAG